MAIAQRAGNATGFASASSGTLTAFNCQTGDVIVVVYAIRTTTSTGNAPTDTIGNTYTQANAINNGTNIRCEIWTCVSTGSNASNVITWHTSANTKCAIAAESYSGTPGINPNNTVSSTQSSANPTQNLTLTAANNWFVAGFAGQSTGTFTISTGNNRQNAASSGGSATTNAGGALGDNTAASASSVTVAYTNTDTIWSMCGVELIQPPSDDCETWDGNVGVERPAIKAAWDDAYDMRVTVGQ